MPTLTRTTTNTLLTPKRPKRSGSFDDTGENGPEDKDDLLPPFAPRKRGRFLRTSAGVRGVVEDADPCLSSKLPESQIDAENYPGLPLSRTPSKSSVDESAGIDRFIDDYKKRTKTPSQFLISLIDLSKEDTAKLRELGHNGGYDGVGHRLRVSWMQYAKLMELKLVRAVEEFPENFWRVMERAEEEAKGRKTGL